MKEINSVPPDELKEERDSLYRWAMAYGILNIGFFIATLVLLFRRQFLYAFLMYILVNIAGVRCLRYKRELDNL